MREINELWAEMRASNLRCCANWDMERAADGEMEQSTVIAMRQKAEEREGLCA